MTMTSTRPAEAAESLPARAILGLNRLLALFPYWLIALGARAALVRVFWWSARTKAVDGSLLPHSLDGFRLNDTAVYLFSDEYKVHLLDKTFDLPNPPVMATLAMIAEHGFAALLFLGLATRYAGLGLLGMTAFIETIYPQAYNEHLPWAVCAMILVKGGGGLFSVDHWIGRGRFLPALAIGVLAIILLYVVQALVPMMPAA